ncbi:conserved protein of unknown function [Ectopseudomonas oleovorans]|uniref:Uncharacterized protein n=1 Tax=Ectopseudomonas oleovorans TaxID=301 RepID=A0A653B833_ECTOL|nr:conserved protein of unknown function [Pseudomonas oleovorans]
MEAREGGVQVHPSMKQLPCQPQRGGGFRQYAPVALHGNGAGDRAGVPDGAWVAKGATLLLMGGCGVFLRKRVKCNPCFVLSVCRYVASPCDPPG